MENIRNFSIIAHVDHGKSTLSDCFIQVCGGLHKREMVAQVLDSMDLERERGITIKAQSVTLNYRAMNDKVYQLNFIDTPGHVDFSYEVSRSLSACEGALLVVDAAQGVEAQTIANCNIAISMNLKIVLVLNKIDLSIAEPNRVSKEIEDMIGISAENAILCSAKTGLGVLKVLESIVKSIPAPQGNSTAPLQALIIDSWFDNYLGVVSLIRIKNGMLCKGDKIRIMSTKESYIIDKLGIFTPKRVERVVLYCGEVGWFVSSIKNIFSVRVGDTLTLDNRPAYKSLSGFKKIVPCVYAGLFPINTDNQVNFRNALYKLSLNDAALVYAPEHSGLLGFGFRCGFLGLLHLDIIRERLEREYKINLVVTPPIVMYEVLTKSDDIIYVDNSEKFLSLVNIIKEVREPIVLCKILSPKRYLGNIITLCVEKRGVQIDMIYHDNHVVLHYELPMSEVILDFFNQVKSISQGYASLEYKFKRYQCSDIVCVEILINGKSVNTLAFVSHYLYARYRAKEFVNKLQALIPRRQFNVIIQAVIMGRVVARASVKQLRKNVIAKCYGGDVTRKQKLLINQKEGKKRMKHMGDIKLSREIVLTVLDLSKKV